MLEVKKTRIQVRNRKNIILHATSAFARHGFKGTTMESIADLADMSQPNLHNYFRTKLDLYVAVLESTLDIWLEPIDALRADGDPGVELSGYIGRKLEMTLRFPEASRVFAHEMLDGAPVLKRHLKSRIKCKADEFASIVEAWIRSGRFREVNPHHLLFMIWSSTQHYADFSPQVSAVLGQDTVRRADIEVAHQTITSIVLMGVITGL